MHGYALIDIPRSGVENMALDQRMLEMAAERQCIMLRVYQWSEPTLSLGYFQPYAQRLSHSPSSQIDVVRRSTGGGAIVHHEDWTYCIAVPEALSFGSAGQSHVAAKNIGASPALYDCMHDAVVDWLNELGMAVRKWTQACAVEYHKNSASSTSSEVRASGEKTPFLCFERRSCGDVVWGDEKVMGSAQRRIPGAVLQHGSLLLAPSPHAPSLSGLDLASHTLPVDATIAEDPSHPTLSRRHLASLATLNEDGHGSFSPEAFFQRLIQAVQAATHVKLECLASLTVSPIQWNWPTATRFAETSWTERL